MAKVVEGLLLSPIIVTSLKAQVETFVAFIFTTDIVMLTIIETVSVFKKKKFIFLSFVTRAPSWDLLN